MAKAELAFEDWMASAIGLALRCYAEGDETPLLMGVDAKGQQHLVEIQIAGELDGQHLANLARDIVDAKWRRYAILMSGFYTSGRTKKPAVIVECGEAGMAEAMMLAQPYRLRKRPPTCEPVGAPVVVETVPNPLKPARKRSR